MTLKEYIKFRKKTKVNRAVSKISYLGLGIAGEAGEVADAIKKLLRDAHSEMSATKFTYTLKKRENEIAEELGDVLWYWIGLCEYLGITPEKVMELNKKKLTKRYLCGKNAQSK